MAALSPHELAVAIEACAFAAVPNTPESGWPIKRHGVVMGEIAWDNCECGQLVVAETRRFPATTFPVEEINSTAECNEPWIVVQYTLSLTRCIPVADESGNPPAIAALTESAQRNSLDMTAVRRAVLCCLNARYEAHEVAAYQLGAQEVTGPQGLCGGFDLTVLAGWTNDCGC